MIYYSMFKTSLCKIILLGNEEGISRLHMLVDEGQRSFKIPEEAIENDAIFADARKQLVDYADGKLKSFDLKLKPVGTDFQKRVWQALENIPYGETRTYKEIAVAVGNEKASRAVGSANNKNPIPIIIPCHRVIGSKGQLTGFAFGLAVKEKMIDLEESNK